MISKRKKLFSKYSNCDTILKNGYVSYFMTLGIGSVKETVRLSDITVFGCNT